MELGVCVMLWASPAGVLGGSVCLRKFLGSKKPLDWLKIGLNSAKKNYAYVFENIPEKLIWKSHYKGGGGDNSGELVIT